MIRSGREDGTMKGEGCDEIEEEGGNGGRDSGTDRVGRGFELSGSTDLRKEVKTSGRSLMLLKGRS